MNEVEVIKIVRNHVEQLPVRNNIVHRMKPRYRASPR